MSFRRQIFWSRLASFWWIFVILGGLILGYDIFLLDQRSAKLVKILYRGSFDKYAFKIKKIYLDTVNLTGISLKCKLSVPSDKIRFFNSDTTDFYYRALYRVEVYDSDTHEKVWSDKEELQRTERIRQMETIGYSSVSFMDFESFGFHAPKEGYYDIFIATGFYGDNLEFHGCTVKVDSSPPDLITPQMEVLFLISLIFFLVAGILWVARFFLMPVRLG